MAQKIHDYGSESGQDSGMGMMMGVILIVVVLLIFFFYGLPMLNNSGGGGGGTTVKLPSSVNVQTGGGK